jgi:branched-chain amino acid transport system ATP-binding protein
MTALLETPLLETRGIWQRFGGLVANSDVSISVGRGEIVGLIGPNGAGKSTLFNLIAGVYTPTQGSIILNG